MCILFWTVDNHPKYKFVFASNRDEFIKRPTSQAEFWKEPHDNILAGIDLEQHQNGTWLGITKEGRFSALTNYREKNFTGEISRGILVRDFLYGKESVHEYFNQLTKKKDNFAGFNLINIDFGKDDLPEMAYFTNREEQPISNLEPGKIYGLSNSILNNPWEKVKQGKLIFEKMIKENTEEKELLNALLDLLATTKPMNNENDVQQIFADLKERIHIPLFNFPESLDLNLTEYGTRTSCIILIDYENNVTFLERLWNNQEKDLIYHFKIKT